MLSNPPPSKLLIYLIIEYLLGTFPGEQNYIPGLTVVPRPCRTKKEIVTDDDLRCQVYIHICIKRGMPLEDQLL